MPRRNGQNMTTHDDGQAPSAGNPIECSDEIQERRTAELMNLGRLLEEEASVVAVPYREPSRNRTVWLEVACWPDRQHRIRVQCWPEPDRGWVFGLCNGDVLALVEDAAHAAAMIGERLPTERDVPSHLSQFARALFRLRCSHTPPLSLRGLSKLIRYSHVYLWQIEHCEKRPTLRLAAACDRALSTGGTLTGLLGTPTRPRAWRTTAPPDQILDPLAALAHALRYRGYQTQNDEADRPSAGLTVCDHTSKTKRPVRVTIAEDHARTPVYIIHDRTQPIGANPATTVDQTVEHIERVLAQFPPPELLHDSDSP